MIPLLTLFFVFSIADYNTCETKLTIMLLPLTMHTTTIESNTTKTSDYCGNTEAQSCSEYIRILTHSKELIIDTCASNSGSSALEIIDSCEQSICLNYSSKYCGDHSYMTYSSNGEGIDVILRVICTETPCNLIIKMQYPDEIRFDSCITPKLVSSPFTDSFSTIDIEESFHGCGGGKRKNKGRWYKIEPSKDYKTLSVVAYRLGNYKFLPVEIKNGCEDYYCSVRYGTIHLDLTESKYLFVDCSDNDGFIQVDFSFDNTLLPSQCENSLQLTFPYSTVLWNYIQPSSKSFCDGDYTQPIVYHFKLEESSLITLSTCSFELPYDSMISVASGSCSELVCVEKAVYSSNNSGSFVQFTAQANTNYFVQVGSLVLHSVGEFVFKATQSSMSKNTKSSHPFVIEKNGSYELTVDTRNSYISEWKENGVVNYGYGLFVSLNIKKDVPIIVSSCSPITDTDTILKIVYETRFDESENKNYFEVFDSTDFVVSSCGAFGKSLKFSSFNPSYYVFIGSTQKIESKMVHVTVEVGEYGFPSEVSDESNDDENDSFPKWAIAVIVVGVIFILLAFVFAMVGGFLLLKKKKTGYNLVP